MGEQTANHDILSFAVASAAEPPDSDRPLTPDELKERQRRLSLLSRYHVAEEYRRLHHECRMEGSEFPKASAIQELVAAWRVLWGWKRKTDG